MTGTPPRFAPRPIACPRCGDVRVLAAAPRLKLRCPRCRAEYPCPAPMPAPPAPDSDPATVRPSLPPPAPSPEAPAVAGPSVIDVAAVTIRPAPPPAAGIEHPAPLTPSGPGVPSAKAAKTDDGAGTGAAGSRVDGLPAAGARTSGRDRRPIRRPHR